MEDEAQILGTRSSTAAPRRGLPVEVVFPAIVALVSTLAGAAIGAYVSSRVATISTEANFAAQRETLEEQRRSDLRNLRIDAYRTFLSALDTLTDTQADAFHACHGAGPRGNCDMLVGRQLALATKFERAFDGIATYGSDEQFRLGLELQLLVTKAAIALEDRDFTKYEEGLRDVVETRIEFQRQMCLDVNTAPRGDCRNIRPRPR